VWIVLAWDGPVRNQAKTWGPLCNRYSSLTWHLTLFIYTQLSVTYVLNNVHAADPY